MNLTIKAQWKIHQYHWFKLDDILFDQCVLNITNRVWDMLLAGKSLCVCLTWPFLLEVAGTDDSGRAKQSLPMTYKLRPDRKFSNFTSVSPTENYDDTALSFYTICSIMYAYL